MTVATALVTVGVVVIALSLLAPIVLFPVGFAAPILLGPIGLGSLYLGWRSGTRGLKTLLIDAVEEANADTLPPEAVGIEDPEYAQSGK